MLGTSACSHPGTGGFNFFVLGTHCCKTFLLCRKSRTVSLVLWRTTSIKKAFGKAYFSFFVVMLFQAFMRGTHWTRIYLPCKCFNCELPNKSKCTESLNNVNLFSKWSWMKIICEPNTFQNSNSLLLCLFQALPVVMGWYTIAANAAGLKFIWLVNSAGWEFVAVSHWVSPSIEDLNCDKCWKTSDSCQVCWQWKTGNEGWYALCAEAEFVHTVISSICN